MDPGPTTTGDDDDEVIVDPEPPVIVEPPEPPAEPRKFYVTEGSVKIATHATRDIEPDGKQLRVTEFRDYTGEVVRTLFPDLAAFRHGWADPDRRAEVLAALQESGINPGEAADALGNPEADPFDLLCGIACNAPVLTRKERAAKLRSTRPDFFDDLRRTGPADSR